MKKIYETVNKKQYFPQKIDAIEWYTVQEVADIFRVHYYTISRWIKTGKLKALQLDKKGAIRIHKSEISKVYKVRGN